MPPQRPTFLALLSCRCTHVGNATFAFSDLGVPVVRVDACEQAKLTPNFVGATVFVEVTHTKSAINMFKTHELLVDERVKRAVVSSVKWTGDELVAVVQELLHPGSGGP